MFHKILIANRGEIAVRIIRACRNMGIRSVAVYSKEDKDSLHVQLADQRICIGEGPARNNYLNMQQIVTAALNIGATLDLVSSLRIQTLYVCAKNTVLHLSDQVQMLSTAWEINPTPERQ